MTETNDTFDWGSLGEAWWANKAKELGATDRQSKFAAAKFRGCSNTRAAKEAGYTATTDAGLRTTGYRLARANIIERLLAFAAGEGDGNDGSVDRKEARRILSGLARGSDPRVRISAVEQINKMDAADRQQRAADGVEPTPQEAAEELLRSCPTYGLAIVADIFFADAKAPWGMPYLEELAPLLKRDYPAIWARFRNAIQLDSRRAEFDALADGPLITVEQLIATFRSKQAAASERTVTEEKQAT